MLLEADRRRLDANVIADSYRGRAATTKRSVRASQEQWIGRYRWGFRLSLAAAHHRATQ